MAFFSAAAAAAAACLAVSLQSSSNKAPTSFALDESDRLELA